MVKQDQIGTTHYSKILDRNEVVKEGPSDEYYKLIGLESVIETSKPVEEKPARKKESTKVDTDDLKTLS